MLMDDKKQALRRMAVGGLAGVAFCLLGVWVLDAMPILSTRWNFDNPLRVWRPFLSPWGMADLLLWGAFGAEIALSTLPFADTGRAVVFRSLAHFCVMALTLWGWVMLNFPLEPLPGLALTFLVPFAAVYALIWLIRWVKWYFELAAIRKKLGLGKKGGRP